MNKPPSKINGAAVLHWAWSIEEPFGWVGDPKDPEAQAIHGVAITKYEDIPDIYRFSCNSHWEVIQDAVYESVEEAIEELHELYRLTVVNWN